ncbi:NAD(P)-binding protein [Cadophora sp. DSE1049]|nr:NAD(P)-binding protein [Cadophora sp. DSE1049]
MADLIIYGATGYTGGLIAAYAKNLGLNFAIAGRSENKVKDLASTLSVPFLIFNVDDRQLVDSALKGTKVLLNCSGPFLHTAEHLIDSCIRNGVHYLDISAELDSYLLAENRDEEAKKAGVMLMPGAGGSVAMFGSLASRVIRPGQKIKSIDIAIAVAGPMSRGSAISASETSTGATLQRFAGELVNLEASDLVQFDFDIGRGPVDSFPVTLPDLITLWKSTEVPNIRTFVHAPGGFPTGELALLPDGPTLEERERNPYQVSIIATTEDGIIQRAVLHTVNGYTFTTCASVEAARRIMDGETRGGFQTPASVFGAGFAETIDGSIIKLL